MTNSTPQWLESWFESNQEQLLADFSAFLRFQSISTQREHGDDMRACVNWLEEKISKLGFTTSIWETSRHPILFAERSDAGPEKPTVLIYNHYDVQPVDPIELWTSAPFDPTVRDGEIFARGAQDNKGQCFYVIAAIAALLERDGTLPVNIKLCIEGEEEAGSVGLLSILNERSNELRADTFLVVDMGIHAMDRPAITLGLRGATFVTLKVRGSNTDLHSGLYGGVAYNPLHALIEILAKVRAEDGSIAIPGFYDDVVPTSSAELAKLDLEFDPHEYQEQTGFAPSGGETRCSPLESAWLRPTLELNGIGGGYFGEGVKTVIPAEVIAKISCRLVPNQQPEAIAQLLKDYFEKLSTPGFEVEVETGYGGGPAVRSSLNNFGVLAATKAIAEVFGQPCRYILSGGSIPVIAEMTSVVGSEPVLLGLGLPGDNMHAPNEHFGIERLRKGTAIIGRTLELLAEEAK